MRGQTKEFISKFFETHERSGSILDVGSLNVSGTIREHCRGLQYVGLDMQSGENVDLVCNAHDMLGLIEPHSYDYVACFDTIEHDDKFWITVENCKKVLKPGGWLFLGAPSLNCPLHRHPVDCWRFLEDGFKALFEDMEDVHLEVQKDDPNHGADDEIYGWGRKPNE